MSLQNEKLGNAQIFDVEVKNRTTIDCDVKVKQLYLVWTCSTAVIEPRIVRVSMPCPQSCLQWLSECYGDTSVISRWFDEIMRGYAAEEIRNWPVEWVSAVPIPIGDGEIDWESQI